MASSHPEVLEYFAANVRRLRVRAGQTQEELAVALGVDLRYMQRIESGSLNVGLLTVARFAGLLGVPPAHLLRKASLPEPKRGRPKKKTKGR